MTFSLTYEEKQLIVPAKDKDEKFGKFFMELQGLKITIEGSQLRVLQESLNRLKPDKTGQLLFCCQCGDPGDGSSILSITFEDNQTNYYTVKYQTLGCSGPLYISDAVEKNTLEGEIEKFRNIVENLIKEYDNEWGPIGIKDYETYLKIYKESLDSEDQLSHIWKIQIIK